MTSYPYLLIDAFTSRKLEGNPCAVVLDADDLSADTMLAVAREMNLSETAFVTHSAVADFGARFFTPAEEIPLAGHPTIATAWALAETGRLAVPGQSTRFTLELRVGPITVVIARTADGSYEVIMTQKKPEFLREYDPDVVLPVFGLTREDLVPGAPIQTVSTGTPQLMIPASSQDALRRLKFDASGYLALRRAGDFFSPHLFCLEGFTSEGATSARHPGVPPDTLEDPFTGSATGGMAAYLWRYGLIDEPTFVAEQGHWMRRPGQARVEVVGPRQDIEAVRIAGQAVTVIRGEMSF